MSFYRSECLAISHNDKRLERGSSSRFYSLIWRQRCDAHSRLPLVRFVTVPERGGLAKGCAAAVPLLVALQAHRRSRGHHVLIQLRNVLYMCSCSTTSSGDTAAQVIERHRRSDTFLKRTAFKNLVEGRRIHRSRVKRLEAWRQQRVCQSKVHRGVSL